MTTFNPFLDDVALSVLQGIGTPFAQKVNGLIASGDWDSIASTWVDPSLYQNSYEYFMDAQALAMFSKIEPDKKRRKVTKKKAAEDFLDAERHCFKTNLRLEKYICNGPFEDPEDVAILGHIRSIQRRIATILGPVPKELKYCGFGKGATYDDRGAEASLLHKITSQPTVTSGARALLNAFYESAWGRSLVAEQPYRSDPCTIRGNRFTTVLKNVKTDRGICVEPSINIFLQLGVGRVIRRKLLKAGLDLDKNQALHRQLAEVASLIGHLATIDLSQASDTVAYNLCKLLLPSDWFELLDSLRSPFTRVNRAGKQHWVKQEKFSSMGNGFTFELETLLFWAIATEASKGQKVYVYGDDMIVPTETARDVLSILKFFGFKPNEKKTFVTGAFRESCGGDFWKGQAVRPYFRKVVPSEPQHWIALANGIRAASLQIGLEPLEGPFRRAWLKALDNLPKHIRDLRGPQQLGDIVIHDSDQSRWVTRTARKGRSYVKPDGKEGTVHGPHPWEIEVKTYSPIPELWDLDRLSPEAKLAVALYGVDSEGYSPRGGTKGYRETWTSFSGTAEMAARWEKWLRQGCNVRYRPVMGPVMKN